MSKRTDERPETDENLDAYAKLLKLSDHVMSVAKPKEPKPNNKHVPKRLVKVADRMLDVVIDMGADILEANRIYVGANLSRETLIKNYSDRIALEEQAKRMSFRLEHIFRMLHYDVEFADSTKDMMMSLIKEERGLLIKWIDAEKNELRRIMKNGEEL